MPTYKINEDTRRRIEHALAVIESMSGDGVTRTPFGLRVRARTRNQFPRRPGHDIAEPFVARITGRTQDGSNKRWTYTFAELSKTSAGYGGWTDLTGGRTGNAYNLAEDQNGASGLYGNGVNSANLTGTFDLQPIPTGRRVRITPAYVTDGTLEYWFEAENGIDGECE